MKAQPHTTNDTENICTYVLKEVRRMYMYKYICTMCVVYVVFECDAKMLLARQHHRHRPTERLI